MTKTHKPTILREEITSYLKDKIKGYKPNDLSLLSVEPAKCIEDLDSDSIRRLIKERKEEVKKLEIENQLGNIKDVTTNPRWKPRLIRRKPEPEEGKNPFPTFTLKRLEYPTIMRLFNINNPFKPSEEFCERLSTVLGKKLFEKYNRSVIDEINCQFSNKKECEVMGCGSKEAATIYISQYRGKSLGPFRAKPEPNHEAAITLCPFCFDKHNETTLIAQYNTLFTDAIEQYGTKWLSNILSVDTSVLNRLKTQHDGYKVINAELCEQIHRLMIGASAEAMLLDVMSAHTEALLNPSQSNALVEVLFPTYEDEEGWQIDVDHDFAFGPDSWFRVITDGIMMEEFSEEKIIDIEKDREADYMDFYHQIAKKELLYAHTSILDGKMSSLRVGVKVAFYVRLTYDGFMYDEDNFPPSVSTEEIFGYSGVEFTMERTINLQNPRDLKFKIMEQTVF